MKKLFCCPALELFHYLPPHFCCLLLWKTARLHGKKLQNATKEVLKQEKEVLKQEKEIPKTGEGSSRTGKDILKQERTF